MVAGLAVGLGVGHSGEGGEDGGLGVRVSGVHHLRHVGHPLGEEGCVFKVALAGIHISKY